MDSQSHTPPLREGKFIKGGLNTDPQTPRPNFTPAPLGPRTVTATAMEKK
jgi:hypothetical protein